MTGENVDRLHYLARERCLLTERLGFPEVSDLALTSCIGEMFINTSSVASTELWPATKTVKNGHLVDCEREGDIDFSICCCHHWRVSIFVIRPVFLVVLLDISTFQILLRSKKSSSVYSIYQLSNELGHSWSLLCILLAAIPGLYTYTRSNWCVACANRRRASYLDS